MALVLQGEPDTAADRFGRVGRNGADAWYLSAAHKLDSCAPVDANDGDPCGVYRVVDKRLVAKIGTERSSGRLAIYFHHRDAMML